MSGGRTLIAILILVGGAGMLFGGQLIFSRFFYLGLLLILVGWVWTQWIGRSLQFKRHSRLSRVSVGDVFEEHFEVFNQSRLLIPWVEVRNQTKMPFATGSRLLTFVRGKQKRQYLARTWLTRRGRFELGPTTVVAGDVFGLFNITKKIAAAQSLLVLPMLVPIQSFMSPPGILPGGQVIRRKSPDVTPHASGVREYAYGDTLKRIHWPTSIRRGQLMVKEFEQDPQSEIWLILDVQRRAHVEKPSPPPARIANTLFTARLPKFQLPPSSLEYGVTVAASLAHYFLQKRRTVGFLASTRIPVMLSSDRSERQENKILETLAFLEADGPTPIAGFVEGQSVHLPQGATAIVITPTVEPELLAAVEDLRKRRLRPMVVLLVAESFGGRTASDTLLLALAERKTPVCPIYCDAELGAALSSFSAQNAQETPQWQRPRS